MTEVLVAFATRGGTTQSIAERVGARLVEAGHAATVAPVQDNPDPAAYEAVVLGSGVLGGSVYPAAGEWATARRAALGARPVALFVTCLGVLAADAQQRCTAQDYPHQLAAILPGDPLAAAVFAGAYEPVRRRRWERLAARLNRAPRGDFRDWDAVDGWARGLAGRL